MVRIFTHSQSFHPDELLAIALLRDTVLRGQRTEIVRTRDSDVLNSAQQDPEAFVIDVGFLYEPERLNFDHHQKTMARAWPDGTPYSACGLVWVWLREQGTLDGWGGADVLDAIEERLVRPADRYDNGIGQPWPEGLFLSAYNRSSRSEDGVDTAFHRALRVAGELLVNVRLEIQHDMEAKRRMQQALAEPIHAEHIVVIEDMRAHRFAHWAARLSRGAVQLVITRRSDDQWNLTSVPRDLEDPFSIACPAPEAWRGQPGHTVDTVAGDANIVFCHKTGYMTVVDGSLAQAIAVAQHIVVQAAQEHVA